MAHVWRRDAFTITDDPARVDLAVVHGFLSTCYWANGIPLETVRRSVANSLNFSLHEGDTQVGYARVISDRATIAYLGDVFVLEPWRGRGLSKWLMQVIVEHPELQGLRRWLLATRDAAGLYRQVGFTPLSAPERWMERWARDVYAPKG